MATEMEKLLTPDDRHAGIRNIKLACTAADCMCRNDCYEIRLDFLSNFLCDF